MLLLIGAVLRIIRGVFEQSHADTHHDRALDLVAACQWVENPSRIDDAHHPADSQAGDLRLPDDFPRSDSHRSVSRT